MNNKGFGITGILIGIIIAIVVGVGGVYVVKNTNLITKNTNETVFIDEIQEDDELITAGQPKDEMVVKDEFDEMADWNTYSIKNYRFKYPQDWVINNETDTSATFFSNGKYRAQLICPIREIGYEAWDIESINREINMGGKITPIKLWNLKAKIGLGLNDFGLILVNSSNFQESCQISIQFDKDYGATTAQNIYSLFDITIQEHSDETADWKTYRNEKFGFEIQYPDDIFALVQSTLSLPLNFSTNYNTSKLISADRVEKLGKKECSYGQSGLISVCVAESESGIEFISVNDSLQNLTKSLSDVLKSNVSMVGKQSVKYSIGSGGDGIDYYYIPISTDKTFVILRKYTGESHGILYTFPTQDLFDQVISTLKFID